MTAPSISLIEILTPSSDTIPSIHKQSCVWLEIKTSMADSNTESFFSVYLVEIHKKSCGCLKFKTSEAYSNPDGPLNFSGVHSLVFGVATYWNIINVMISYNDLDRIEKERTDE